MATAKNDVTGDLITSRVLSKEGRDNYDKIFAKKTAAEWLEFLYHGDIRVITANGWNQSDGVDWETKIGHKDFCERLNVSTISGLNLINHNDT